MACTSKFMPPSSGPAPAVVSRKSDLASLRYAEDSVQLGAAREGAGRTGRRAAQGRVVGRRVWLRGRSGRGGPGRPGVRVAGRRGLVTGGDGDGAARVARGGGGGLRG